MAGEVVTPIADPEVEEHERWCWMSVVFWMYNVLEFPVTDQLKCLRSIINIYRCHCVILRAWTWGCVVERVTLFGYLFLFFKTRCQSSITICSSPTYRSTRLLWMWRKRDEFYRTTRKLIDAWTSTNYALDLRKHIFTKVVVAVGVGPCTALQFEPDLDLHVYWPLNWLVKGDDN